MLLLGKDPISWPVPAAICLATVNLIPSAAYAIRKLRIHRAFIYIRQLGVALTAKGHVAV